MSKSSKKKTKTIPSTKTAPSVPLSASTKKQTKNAHHAAAPVKQNHRSESAEKTSLLKESGASLKAYWLELKASFKSDLDPQKLENIRQETKKILTGGAFWLTGIIAVTAIVIVIELHSHERILPRTKVGGIEVGYLKVPEAKAKILVEAEQYLKTPLTFNYEDKKIALTPEEIGIRLALDQTLNRIQAPPFEKQSLALLAGSLILPRDVPFQHTADIDRAISMLEEKFSLRDKRARNAHFVLKEGEFLVEPEAPGVAINRAKLIAALRKNNSYLRSDPINLQVEAEQPRITAEELNQEKERLLGLIQKPLTLVSDGNKLTIKLSDHLDAVQFAESASLDFKESKLSPPLVIGDGKLNIAQTSPAEVKSRLKIKLKYENILPALEEELIKDLEIPTSPVSIYHDAEGKIVIEGKGENGRSVPRNRLMESIALAANNSIAEVPVPILVERAPVTISDDLKDLGIKELLATGHTSYYGSPPNRMHNINVGIQKYNGLIVKPGEEFSFNKYLGEVDGANGYKVEKVIKKNKIELEMGGGICQVSTTLYRAILLAGLPVSERKPHSWKVSYYGQVLGHGLDATIYPGVSDVKFVNDTPGHLLIQSYAEGSNAYFKFYGTSDNRIATLDGPYGSGLHYKWFRNLIKDGQETKETIVSNYKPIPPPEPPPAPPAAPPKPIAQNPAAGPTI